MKIKFEPRDIWVGLYWKKCEENFTFYLCIIPCFPLIFSIKRNKVPNSVLVVYES